MGMVSVERCCDQKLVHMENQQCDSVSRCVHTVRRIQLVFVHHAGSHRSQPNPTIIPTTIPSTITASHSHQYEKCNNNQILRSHQYNPTVTASHPLQSHSHQEIDTVSFSSSACFCVQGEIVYAPASASNLIFCTCHHTNSSASSLFLSVQGEPLNTFASSSHLVFCTCHHTNSSASPLSLSPSLSFYRASP